MRNKGIAIVLALATVLVVSGIGTLIFTRTIREIRHGAQDQGIVQTLMLARGAANLGGSSSPPGAGKGWKGSCSKPRAPRTGGPTAATPGPRRRTLFSWPKRWRTWRTDSSPTLTASFAERTSPRTAYPPRCGSGSTSLRAPAANPFPQRPTSPRGASWRGRPGQGREAGSARPTPFPSSWWPRPPWARPAATSCSRESTASPSDAPASPGTPCSPTCTPFPTGPGSGLPTAPSLTAPCTPTATSASTGARGSAGR